jgi:predicted transcriptional regulator
LTRALFLSIKPHFARAILEGRKTVEVRRKFPSVPAGTVVVLYSSSPEKAVLGTVRLRQATRVDPSQVWARYANHIDIAQNALEIYLKGAGTSTVLEVEDPEPWDQPVTLRELRRILGVEPPQSFRYLAPEQVALIRGELAT